MREDSRMNEVCVCEGGPNCESLVSVLVNFYCSRLSDPASVPNLMAGLVAFTSKFDGFNAACTSTVVSR